MCIRFSFRDERVKDPTAPGTLGLVKACQDNSFSSHFSGKILFLLIFLKDGAHP